MMQSLRIEVFSRRSQALIKPAIILLTLLFCAWAGRRASTSMLIVLVGAAGLVVLLQKPPLGLVGLVIACFTVPFAIGTGTNAAINITMLLVPVLLVVWLLDMWRRRALVLAPSRTTRPLLAFLVAAAVSLVAGNALWDFRVTVISTANVSFIQWGQLILFALCAGAFLLMANLIADDRWLRYVTFTFIGLGITWVLAPFVPGVKDAVNLIFVEEAAGGVFSMWLAALLFGQLLFNRRLGIAWRLLFAATIIALFYRRWVLGRTWATGWLPPLVAMLVIAWLRSRRWGVAVSLFLAVFVIANWSFIFNKIVPAELAQGTMYRPRVWREVIELAASRPLLGLGPANYRYYYQAYHPTATFGRITWILPQMNSHNNFVDIFAQTGLIGLGLFVWFLVEVGRTGWRLRQRVEDGFLQGYVNATLGAFVGLQAACMIADWFLPYVYNVGFSGFRYSVYSWLFFGGLVSLEHLVRVPGVKERPDARAWETRDGQGAI